jgi:tetratricopeptide (TPR) repeat protein
MLHYVSRNTDYHEIGMLYKSKRQYNDAAAWFERGIRFRPHDVRNFTSLAWSYKERGNIEDAIEWFKKAMKIDSDDGSIYRGLGEISMERNNVDEAIGYFKKGALCKYYFEDNLKRLLEISIAHEQQNEIRAFVAMISKKQHYQMLPDTLITADNPMSLIDTWMKRDVEAMVNLCIKKNSAVMLQTYPRKSRCNAIITEVAKNKKTLFMDNENKFDALLASGGTKRDYFMADGHPTAVGYLQMAKHIYAAMVENNIVVPAADN